MKIGILTFHMAHNFGAMLQAYALSCVLKKISGGTCKIIDYRLPEIYDKYENLLKMESVEPKRYKFENFMEKDLPLSDKVMFLDMSEEYDMYVLGSDQIWNPNITNGYKNEYFGLCFQGNTYCISYAASTGISNNDWEYLAEKLVNIDKISVRETWCVNGLANYMNKEIRWCLDPVFLLDNTEWQKLCKTTNCKNYLLIYSFDVLENEYQEIEKMAQKTNANIVEIVTHNRAQREGIIYDQECGPKEFVGYVKDAKYIYTDSYHGVLFSFLFGKRFVYLSRGQKNDARVYDILEQLNVKNDQGYYIMQKENKEILQKYRKKSLEFLEEAVLQVCANEAEV